ncbi:linear amide C-N hydrolase [Hafnia paralvei]|uniref:linear amide C-N hydrolase n=1 Tax=Hafnia paralvei TaxID=546367 RepID=UPI0020005AD7|nr:linear amide C-N hydrolase [Hafnia paralvei]MCK2182326.1 linear amide C-N hydrolase [Hafnia paralvei]
MNNKIKKTLIASVIATVIVGSFNFAAACSRIIYETGNKTYITGRTMDWADASAKTAIWTFPREMARNGGIGEKPIEWVSKYGSVSTSFYDAGTADGMNEEGLVANLLYLNEADFGDEKPSGKETLSAGAWAQYFLDNYATVEEAVNAMAYPPFTIIAPPLPNGKAAGLHLSISDAAGDSAIFEYINGKLTIHHNSKYKVMTNSPTFDQQLALNTYWESVGGNSFLPGTISAADRFVRASYNLYSSPKYKDIDLAVSSVFSQIRAVSVPLGMADPERPNIAMTLWRTVADQSDKVYYFESVVSPQTFWVDMNKIDFSKAAGAKVISVERGKFISGDVSALFKSHEPFKWLGENVVAH